MKNLTSDGIQIMIIAIAMALKYILYIRDEGGKKPKTLNEERLFCSFSPCLSITPILLHFGI